MLSSHSFNALLKTLEEPRRAREVHLRHHRAAQGAGDGGLTPASATTSGASAWGELRAHLRRTVDAERLARSRTRRWRWWRVKRRELRRRRVLLSRC